MRESTYQSELRGRIERRFPGCFILKNDEQFCQGIPDLLILYRGHWAMLEVKRSHDFEFEPNQEYYIDMFNDMYFAAVIHPGNEEEVLDAIQLAFRVGRAACVS